MEFSSRCIKAKPHTQKYMMFNKDVANSAGFKFNAVGTMFAQREFNKPEKYKGIVIGFSLPLS